MHIVHHPFATSTTRQSPNQPDRRTNPALPVPRFSSAMVLAFPIKPQALKRLEANQMAISMMDRLRIMQPHEGKALSETLKAEIDALEPDLRLPLAACLLTACEADLVALEDGADKTLTEPINLALGLVEGILNTSATYNPKQWSRLQAAERLLQRFIRQAMLPNPAVLLSGTTAS